MSLASAKNVYEEYLKEVNTNASYSNDIWGLVHFVFIFHRLRDHVENTMLTLQSIAPAVAIPTIQFCDVVTLR